MSEYGKQGFGEVKKPNFPSVTDKVLQLLKDGFMRGYTNEQASFYAGISVATLQAYIKNTDGYLEKVNQYKGHIKILAKNNVWNALKDDDSANLKGGLDVLDRLEKENYSIKQQNEQLGEDGKVVTPVIEVVFKGKDNG